MKSKKVALISGGSSGIGRVSAKYFSDRAYTVYEMSRRAEEQAGVTHISADVSDSESVKMAVNYVLEREKHIDLLLVNAGFGLSGAIEECPEERYKQQFDVNVYGALRLVQAVLPSMRQAKSGRIIMMSSVAALLPIPYQAFYSASKAALMVLARALDFEVQNFGIRVTAFCPGDVKTTFNSARLTDLDENSPYYERGKASLDRMIKDEENGIEAIVMAKEIYQLAEKKHPKTLVIGGKLYKLYAFLAKILPTRIIDLILKQMYG